MSLQDYINPDYFERLTPKQNLQLAELQSVGAGKGTLTVSECNVIEAEIIADLLKTGVHPDDLASPRDGNVLWYFARIKNFDAATLLLQHGQSLSGMPPEHAEFFAECEARILLIPNQLGVQIITRL
jgi:hypothetical protein